ncbi:hypothetical protein NUU61_006731 [Penicillium alfredii]|uniref:Dickkopf N-terminal cysteine-rich domain-containing protein n=1 Tax=Penicillium alfredii TaxID=1506179 RepID=A0A9W9K418_9EURO|nr:uncharacterized protein NUU61_006731 [Penicillium alfredii]KAJ5091861.1 hypothetical protein NUU61_006731 [Penicillium alfredii]
MGSRVSVTMVVLNSTLNNQTSLVSNLKDLLVERDVPSNTSDTSSVVNLPINSTHNLTARENDTSLPVMEVAPPYDFSCRATVHCDWGYYCYKGICTLGCETDDDCLVGQKCKRNRGVQKCYRDNGRQGECSALLRFCSYNEQCCSGYCGRHRSMYMMCHMNPITQEEEQGGAGEPD